MQTPQLYHRRARRSRLAVLRASRPDSATEQGRATAIDRAVTRATRAMVVQTLMRSRVATA